MLRSKLKYLAAVAVVAAAGVSVVVVNQAGGSAPPPYLSYAVKFACGEFGKLIPASVPDAPEGPVKPGDYQTAINVHNPAAALSVNFVKKAVLLYAGSKPVAETTFERAVPPGPLHSAQLGPDFAMLIDCQDIRKVLLPPPPQPAPGFIEGFVILQVPAPAGAAAAPLPLDVQAVYTSHGYNCTPSAAANTCAAASVTREGFSEAVQTITPTLVKQ